MTDRLDWTPKPEEIAEVRSGVHELNRRVDERHNDYGKRFDKIDGAVTTIAERVTRMSVSVATLNKRNDAWGKAIIAVIVGSAVAAIAAHLKLGGH